MKRSNSLPPAQGLYDPAHEHDACGVGFVVNMHGIRSHTIVRQGLEVLENLSHRGACGCDPLTGDGAGILLQMPQEFLRPSLRRRVSSCQRATGARAMYFCRRRKNSGKVPSHFLKNSATRSRSSF